MTTTYSNATIAATLEGDVPILTFGNTSRVGLAIDCTSSMTDVLASLSTLWAGYLVRYAARREDMGANLETITLIGHGDHERNPHYPLFRLKKQTDNLEEAVYLLSQLIPLGGGDTPECHAYAVDTLRELSPGGMNWLITDAPAHGQYDSFQSDNSLPCPVYGRKLPRDIYRGIHVIYASYGKSYGLGNTIARSFRRCGAASVTTFDRNEGMARLFLPDDADEEQREALLNRVMVREQILTAQAIDYRACYGSSLDPLYPSR